MFGTVLLAAAEILTTPTEAGFVVGYQAAAQGNAIVEKVPKGETVEDWTRMLTTQKFAGVARKVNGYGFLQLMIDNLQAGCPGAAVVYRRPMAKDAEMRVDCPLNPKTRKPETFFAKAVSGAADMHVAQVAFRRVPSDDDVKWAEDYLAKVALKP